MTTSIDDAFASLSSRRTRILVVDDELSALMVIPEALRDGLEDRGWRDLVIETASTGEEAVALGSQGDLDLLVADVVMPGIDGIEAYSRLKQRHPQLTCVVMTAHAPQHSTPIRALRLGVADYVSKPIKPDALVETCHRLLVVHHLRRQVEESRRLLGAIIENVDAGVIALSGDAVLCQNHAARHLLGEEHVARRLEQLGLGDARAVAGTAKRVDDVRIPLPDGRLGRFSVAGSPVVDGSGHTLGDVVVLRDLTDVIERKEVDSFKRMAAIAAHEMKNSVTGLGLVMEHLVARLDVGRLEPEETRRMARIVLDAVARLDRFAKSFLGFSRIPDPTLRAADPNALVRDALELYASDARGLPSWVTVETELAEGLPEVRADADLMFQVLQNLIINAVQAMESSRRGRITLSTAWVPAPGDGRVRITVADEGPGVPPHLHEAIFEPNVTTREAGTGLGLVIVRDIVHKHGGEVRLESQPGSGARFHILLPALTAGPAGATGSS